jgi:tRNA methyl transferase HUP domain
LTRQWQPWYLLRRFFAPIHLDKPDFKHQDYDLSAVYMRNWDTRDESGSDIGCQWERDWEDVQQVCSRLGIPCELVCALAYIISFVTSAAD